MTKAIEAKVVLLGATHVGKTSIITHAVANFYDPNQEMTVGPSFSVKMINLENRTVRLLIWDTAGQEQYRTLGSLYYHGAQSIILVFSLVDKDSLTDAERWAAEVRSHFDVVPPLYLVGNKTDLADKRTISRGEGVAVAEKIGASYTETSVVRGQNINELFTDVAEHVGEPDVVISKIDPAESESKCEC
jgi:small GTP-binding protein